MKCLTWPYLKANHLAKPIIIHTYIYLLIFNLSQLHKSRIHTKIHIAAKALTHLFTYLVSNNIYIYSMHITLIINNHQKQSKKQKHTPHHKLKFGQPPNWGKS